MYQWTKVTGHAPFAPRDGAGALVFKDKMWLLGGWNPNDKVHFPRICNSEVWSSIDGLDWHLEVPQAPWEGRHYAGYVVHDGRMWIVGGDPNQGHYQNDVWNSDDGIIWRQVTDHLPWGPRVFHHTLAFNGRIWVMGGQALPQFASTDENLYGDVWCSTDGAAWEKVLDNAPWGPRGLIGNSAVLKGRMWILGGGTYDTPAHPQRTFHNDVWSSSDGRNWQQYANTALWAPRQMHEVAVFDGRLWIMEGYNLDGNRNDVWYSDDGVSWTELPNSPWLPRHAASVFVYHDVLWLVAGNNMTPDVWRLNRL